MTAYFDLDRRFIEITDKTSPEDSAQQSYLTASLLGRDTSLGWAELLQRHVTVILGEPGSGKTIEFRLQVDKLNKQAKKAFLLQLDRLVREPLTDTLSEQNQIDFRDWSRGNEEAYFFFDSVDESKLVRSDDFLLALQRISDAIPNVEMQRAKLIFSSRISEWRPATDLQALRRIFHGKKAMRSERSSGRSFQFLRDNDLDIQQQPGDVSDEVIPPLVVQMLPLDEERVRIYAHARGLTNVDDFIRALDDHHAWEFARRPLDVHGLIDLWISRGQLGTLTELIENGITLSLRETESRERQAHLTSEAEARNGAEILAAASLLCRNLNFKVPDDSYVSTSRAALDASACLPATWPATDRQALMARALFDSATYGCIRFHHRRTMEYLAASWFEKRMLDGCPQDHLDDLLFDVYQGESVLRPTLSPIAAWLANGSEPHNMRVRDRLLESAPGVHLKYGDPERLPLEYKRRVLNALSLRYSDRGWGWRETDTETLARLADPLLADDISALIRNRQLPDSLRADMLLMVRHGQLDACLEAALEVFNDPAEDDDIKYYALAAMRDCSDAGIRARLVTAVRERTTISSRLAGILCETLYPEAIDEDELANLLRISQATNGRTYDLPWILKHHFQERLATDRALPLLSTLIQLIRTAPYLEDGREDHHISQQFHWLCDVLPIVLTRLFEKHDLSIEESRLSAEGLRIVDEELTFGSHMDAKEIKHLSSLTNRHSLLKNEYFWQGVERYRTSHPGQEPDWIGWIVGYRNVVEIVAQDISWLIEAVRARQSHADRLLAMHFAFELWQPYKFQWKNWLKIFRAVSSQEDLRRSFWRYSCRSITLPIRALWYRYVRNQWLNDHFWTRIGLKFRRIRNELREWYLLHRYIHRLYSGTAVSWLANLSHEATRDTGLSRWAADDWTALRKKRDFLVSWATKHGCESIWVNHVPQLPHEKPNANRTSSFTVAGLSGLQSLWRQKRLLFINLSDDDATRIARYAMNELNGFPDWLPELASAKPQAVRNVLMQCIEAEWQYPPERGPVSEIIQKLEHQRDHYGQLISDALLSQLQLRDPVHQQILNDSISILLKISDSFHLQLSSLASRRVAGYHPTSDHFCIWIALWLHLEARGAIDHLVAILSRLALAEADNIVLRLCTFVRGEGFKPEQRVYNPDYLQPETMRIFVPLVYRHVRPSEDIDHNNGQAYSVTDRDRAQDFRNGLLTRLSRSEHPDALSVLKAIRNEPELSSHREWLEHLIEQFILQHADLLPWQPEDIRSFMTDYEANPRNDTDLFRIGCWRLMDIKRDVEQAENSLRGEVHRDWNEAELRMWFQRKLIDRSRRRYTIPQEAEIDQRQRPDLRFECPGISAVPVEIKWADSWTAAELLERLENQLVGQYLRAYTARYGIYLIGYIGKKQHWDHPTEQRRIDYSELVGMLEQRARELELSRPNVASLRVVAIDFTVPSRLQ